MSSWGRYLFILLMVVSYQRTQAQEDAPPQEPPYIQEDSEFDVVPADEEPLLSGEEADVELEMQEALPPAEKSTVDLNQLPKSEEGLGEEDVEAEDAQSVVEEIVPVPAEEPVPAAVPKQVEVLRHSKSGGVEYIQHPQAAKGLMSITKDGAYIYRVREPSVAKTTGAFRVGMINSPQIESADEMTSYEMMYGGPTQTMFMFDYEWKPFSRYGSLGVQAGFGLMLASGKGRFVTADPQFPDQEAKEEYTFLAIPLNLGGVYRLEWLSRQWLAPYVAGGGTYMGVIEYRDDGKSPSMVGTPGLYAAGGVLFNISALDRETAFTLDSEYGITNLWLSLEYRQLQTFSEDVNFSSGITSAGISVDY